VISSEVFSGDVLCGDVIKQTRLGALWALLADSPVGGVVEGWFRPDDIPLVVDGLRRCGLDPATVFEVWYSSVQVEASVGPLGLGPTVSVDTASVVGQGDIVRIALEIRSASAG